MMKSFNLYICISVILTLAFSCNNDFLKEEPIFDMTSHSTPFYISPNWEPDDYRIFCEDIGNAAFTVVETPEWLTVSTLAGQFVDNTAVLHCKANTFNDFSEPGLFYSYITLSVERKENMAFPVAYISEGNPKIDMNNFFLLDYKNRYTCEMPIANTGDGVLLWHIKQYPEWLAPMSNDVNIITQYSRQDRTVISYNYDDCPFWENLSGKIVIETNDINKPVMEVTVQVDFGYPVLNIGEYFSTVDFGWTQTSLSFSFFNQGDGLLIWEIEGCPEWLTVSQSNGFIYPFNSANMTFTCNRELLLSGENTAIIYLKTNDLNKPLVPVIFTAIRNLSANPDNVMDIPGNVVSVIMDKQSDILYLITNQPNRLLAYDTQSKALLRELSLDDEPACFGLSEDGHGAIIGHNGYISYIDADNFTLVKTIETNHNVKDIEWGVDNWCCYSISDIEQSCLHWINLNTNEMFYDDQLSGYGFLCKIPNQNFVIALTGDLNGTHIYNLNTRKIEYVNSCFVSGFFSENGEYMYSSDGRIYNTSSFYLNVPAYIATPVGKFSPIQNSFFWIDHNETTQSIWCLSPWSNRYTDYEIIQYDDSEYARIRKFYYSDYYNDSPVMLHYIFTNQAGTELVIIRNVTGGNFMWSLEFFPVEQNKQSSNSK